MTISDLNRYDARAAIESLVGGVAPSPSVTNLISVGIDDDLRVFEEEYFGEDGLLRHTDQGTFKLVEAYYGGGKTHYLRAVERLAHRHGFASAFIELNKDSCPLTRFDLIYSSVVKQLTAPRPGHPNARGIGEIIRTWVEPPADWDGDSVQYAQSVLQKAGDLPLSSMRIAIQLAGLAVASGDSTTYDEVMVYLNSGMIAPALKRKGVLEKVDVRSGSLAIRTLAVWLRQIGYPGLLLIMDEGDRSLSIANTKERKTASNNLVQIINETLKGSDWPGVMFLYSIPGWTEFKSMLSADNQALDQRVRTTGFPTLPPAPRIVLDDRYQDDGSKTRFCVALGERLLALFNAAGLSPKLSDGDGARIAERVARAVLRETVDVSFRRMFVKTFIKALYHARSAGPPSDSEISNFVTDAR
ncbi:MAG: hypothetical protein EP329_09870 [Deltaproteobacteria bacterium]|nr:MAG: hypothetical protein EP329_09870 [Deltaproteobacteria bacterium]